MKPLKSFASSRVTTYVAALGCAGLLSSIAFSAGDRIYTGASAAASVVDPSAYPAGAICHTPAFTNRLMRLAQTEVSPMARQAAPDPAAAFEAAEPPLWSNLGTITYKITTANPEAQTPAIMESDEALRRRALLAPEAYSVAGPEGAYISHALGASGDVLDASCGGLGGCPFAPDATGNIGTEDLVFMLERAGFETGYDLGRLIETAKWASGLLGKPPAASVSRAGGFPLNA